MQPGLSSAASAAQQPAPPPRAVDFAVPPGVRVVTITGPNTGGKTAALKALGLAALLPKAGLFLPLARAEGPAGAALEHACAPLAVTC